MRTSLSPLRRLRLSLLSPNICLLLMATPALMTMVICMCHFNLWLLLTMNMPAVPVNPMTLQTLCYYPVRTLCWCRLTEICLNFCEFHSSQYSLRVSDFPPCVFRRLCDMSSFSQCTESLRTPFGETCAKLTKEEIQ